ncbi:uncharacterized protein LOC116418030 [Nasonia vitripennis]|uniref:Peptidase A2 domain-containing protein n=1 Tax=Nasonia vitripennis TaxID=7425 RepID=A0A7M7QK88_NASVI|nr:uncharacterized protein LOC116418030 [Nasonia vitripennis]
MSRDQFVNTKRGTKYTIDFDDSLLTQLKDKENELKSAIQNNSPEATKLIQEVDRLTKEVKNSCEKFNIDADKNPDLPRNKYEFYQYRLNSSNQLGDSDEEVVISEVENEQDNTVQFNSKIYLKPSALKKHAESSCIGTSTPISRGLTQNNITSIFGSLEIRDTPINGNVIDTIKQQLSIEIKPEVLEAFFADENNAAEINKTINSPGFGFFQAIKLVRDRLSTYATGTFVPPFEKFKIETSRSHQDSSNESEPFLSFDQSLNTLKIQSTHNKPKIEQKSRIMAETIQVRGMSISNVLDLISRFNGQNVSLSLFLDGCREAKELLPSTLEGELAKFIRMRLYGDALNSTRGQTFTSVNDVIEFFENIYGSAKTFHEWSGDLAKMKQKGNESEYSHVRTETINLSRASTVPTIKVDIGEFNKPLEFMLDTGASVSLVRKSEISPYTNIKTDEIIRLKGITTQSISTLGKVTVDFNNVSTDFHLVDDDFPIAEAGILGNDFFRKNEATINYFENYIEVNGQIIPFEKYPTEIEPMNTIPEKGVTSESKNTRVGSDLIEGGETDRGYDDSYVDYKQNMFDQENGEVVERSNELIKETCEFINEKDNENSYIRDEGIYVSQNPENVCKLNIISDSNWVIHGFPNEDNVSCYANACIQSLFHCISVRRILLEGKGFDLLKHCFNQYIAKTPVNIKALREYANEQYSACDERNSITTSNYILSLFLPDPTDIQTLQEVFDHNIDNWKNVEGECNDANQSIIDDPSSNAIWARKLHEVLNYLLEKADETSEIVNDLDEKNKQINERVEKIDSEYLALNINSDTIKTRIDEIDANTINKLDYDDLDKFNENIERSIDSKVALKFSELRLESQPEVNLSDNVETLIDIKIRKHEEDAEVILMNLKQDITSKLTALTNTSQNLLKITRSNEKRVKSLEVEHITYNNTLTKFDEELKNLKTHIENSNKTFKEEFQTLTDRLNKIRSSNHEIIMDGNNTSLSISSKSPKLKPPTFRADTKEKPMRYLRDLKRYLDVLNVDGSEMNIIISQTLENTASSWFDIAQHSINNISDFERKFKARFWNEDIQDEWSRKVEYNRYNPDSKYSHLEYATYVWGFAQDLERNFSEAELVRKISNHFDWDIRFTVKSQNINSQDKFFELLAFKDNGNNQRQSLFKKKSNPEDTNTEFPSNHQSYKSANQQSNFKNKKFQRKFPQTQTLNVIEANAGQTTKVPAKETDTKYDEITIRMNSKIEKLSYKNENLLESEMDHRYIEIIEEDLTDCVYPHSLNGPVLNKARCSNFINELTYRQNDRSSLADPYDLSDKEIDEKLKFCVTKSPETINELKNLLQKYRKVFYGKPATNMKGKLREQIGIMLEWKVIRRSSSNYISPIVPVFKKDGSIRFCLDARKVNDMFEDDL